MANRKVAFCSTFYTEKTLEPTKELTSYERRLKRKRSPGRWLHLSSMTCRDFSNKSYDYHDTHFKLSDKGRTYNPASYESQKLKPQNKFQKTELRFIEFQPGKTRADNRKVFSQMTESSVGNYALSEIYQKQ